MDAVAEQCRNFMGILLVVGSTEDVPHFTQENYSRTVQWASYVEKLLEDVIDETEFDEMLKRISSNYIEFKRPLGLDSLSCARHLILRAFLHNPYIAQKPLLQAVLLDYLNLANGESVTPDMAKEKLAKDIYSRGSKQALAQHLLKIAEVFAQSGGEELFSMNGYTGVIETNYEVNPDNIPKKAFARLLRIDLVNILQSKVSRSEKLLQFFSKLKPCCKADINCLETVALIFLVEDSLEATEIKAQCNDQVYNFLLSFEESLWAIHPWILTGICDKSFPFLQHYIQFLTLNYLKSEINREDIHRRFLYLSHRNNRMRQICQQILQRK